MCLILEFLDNRWEKFKYCAWNSAPLRTADLHYEMQHAGSTLSPSWCQLGHLNSLEKYIGVSRPARIWKRLFLYACKGSFIAAIVWKVVWMLCFPQHRCFSIFQCIILRTSLHWAGYQFIIQMENKRLEMKVSSLWNQ